MIKNIYLSIDPEFWKGWPIDLTFIDTVLAIVPKHDVCLVLNHRNILPHTRRYNAKCTRLVNMDCCSNLGGADEFEIVGFEGDIDTRPQEFSDTTWADYVAFYNPEEFIWAYPSLSCPTEYDCRPDFRITRYETSNNCSFERVPVPDVGHKYWQTLSHYHAVPPDYGIDLSTVRAVGISLSSWPKKFTVPFLQLARSYDLQVFDCLPERLESELQRLSDAVASTTVSPPPTTI
jgi:hypothetical protein